MVSEKLGAAFVEVGADLSPLEKSLGSIPGMMQHAGTNITAGLKASLQGGNFTDVGKQLGNQLVTGMTSQFGMLGQTAGTFATALGPAGIALLGIAASIAVIGVGLGKCVSSAATWQDLMVDVQKVTTTTESQFSKLSSDLLAIRGSTGASMEDIAGAAAGAGRMGIAPEEIADYTEVILKMSSAWGVSADASSDAIGKIGAAVKPAEMAWADFANRSGSLINDLADTTVTSEAAIIQGLSKLTGSMKDFKVQPDQLAGWASMVAYLQEMGDTDVGAGEHIKDALREITKTTHGEDIAALIGVDFGELQEMIRTDTIGTFELLAAAIADLPLEEQGDAFALFGDSGAEAMKKFAGGVDETTGSISRLGEIAATGNSAWENATSLNEQYAKSQETLNAQIEIFKGKISVAAVSIGSVLLPHLTQMMQDINGITQALMDLGAKGWKWLYGGVDDEGAETKGAIGRLTGWLDEKLGIEYGAKLGEEMGEAAAPEVAEGVQAGLESVDGKGAGEKVGKAFGDAVAEMTKAGVSREIASMYALGASGDLAALEMWNQYSGREQSGYRYGEMFSAGGSDIAFGYNKSKGSPYLLSVGNVQKGFGSYAAAEEWLRTEYPMVYAAMDPRQLDVAMRTARSSTYFDDDAVVVQLKAELAGGKSAWDLFAEELAPTQAQIAEIQAAYESAFQEAMGGGAFVGDMKTAMEDLGKTGAKAFSDGWISGTEAAEMVAEYSRLKVFDPERYTELGGDGAVAFWEGAKEKLETLAALEAAGQLGTIEYKDALEDLSQHLNDPANTVYVRGKLDVGVSPEVSAFREALFWEGAGGYEAQKGLGEFQDDLYALSQTLNDLGADAEAAYRIITNPWDYQAGTVSLAKDFLKSVIPDTVDPASIDAIAAYYVEAGRAAADKAGKQLRSEISEAGGVPGWFGGFAKWQESDASGLFSKSYIGPTEGWAGPGQGAKAGWESKNYFQYDVEVDLTLDPSTANTELEKLEGEIGAEKIAPVIADIEPAMTELERLEAEIMAPTTKPVWLEVMNPDALGSCPSCAKTQNLSWMDSGGIAYSPVIVGVGERRPEAIAPLADLLPMIQQAVASAGGSSGEIHIGEINVYSSGDAEEVARAVVEEFETRIARSVRR